MNKIQLNLRLAAAAIVIAIAVVFQASADAADQLLTKVRFGVAPYQDTLLPLLGSDKYLKLYRQEGLDVEFKILALDEIRESLAAGQLDVTINEMSAIICAHNKQPDLVFWYGFNTFDNGFALMIRTNSGIKSVSDFEKELGDHQKAVVAAAKQLKGKTVITTGNSDFEMAVAMAATRGGLNYSKGDKSDVRIFDLPPDDGLAAFLSGKGDAYLGGIPQRTRAGKEGMVEMMSGLDLGAAPINGLCTTKSFDTAHHEIMLKLLKVWFEIVNYAEKNPDQAGAQIAGLLNERTGAQFTVDDFKHFWQHYEHYPLSPREIQVDILSDSGSNYWKSRWDNCNDFFCGLIKIIPNSVQPEGAFLMQSAQDDYVRKYGNERPK